MNSESSEAMICRRLKDCTEGAVGPLEALAEELAPTASIAAMLLRICDEPSLEANATWVLKRIAERGAPLGPDEWSALTRLLKSAQTHHGLLHVLQVLDPGRIDPRRRHATADRLIDLTHHERPFVRAWAYGVLVGLSPLLPRRQAELESLIDRAEMTETASVQARIRRARADLERTELKGEVRGTPQRTRRESRRSPPRR